MTRTMDRETFSRTVKGSAQTDGQAVDLWSSLRGWTHVQSGEATELYAAPVLVHAANAAPCPRCRRHTRGDSLMFRLFRYQGAAVVEGAAYPMHRDCAGSYYGRRIANLGRADRQHDDDGAFGYAAWQHALSAAGIDG